MHHSMLKPLPLLGGNRRQGTIVKVEGRGHNVEGGWNSSKSGGEKDVAMRVGRGGGKAEQREEMQWGSLGKRTFQSVILL